MRQAQEEDIARRQLVEGTEAEPGEAAQVGVHPVREPARHPLGGDLPHFHRGVPEQEPQQLSSRVPRRPGDRRADHVVPTASAVLASPAVPARPARETRYDTMRSGMFTPVASMLFRNSIV